MKQFLLVLAVLFTSLTASAQFDVKSGKETGETISIEDKSYPTFKTTAGSEYIVCHSPKSDKDYPVWIGTKADKTYQGKPLRQSKSGKYFYFMISKNGGNPYCKYLKEEEIQ